MWHGDRIMETPDIVGEDTRTFALRLAVSPRFRRRLPQPAANDPPVEVSPAIVPIVAHGYWMALCPWCGGGETVMRSDPVMYCLNPACPRPHGGRLLAVVFPPERTIQRATQALIKRRSTPIDRRTGRPAVGGKPMPDIERWAWYPEVEGPDELVAQNVVLGFERP